MAEPIESVIRETIANARKWECDLNASPRYLLAGESTDLTIVLHQCHRLLATWLKERSETARAGE